MKFCIQYNLQFTCYTSANLAPITQMDESEHSPRHQTPKNSILSQSRSSSAVSRHYKSEVTILSVYNLDKEQIQPENNVSWHASFGYTNKRVRDLKREEVQGGKTTTHQVQPETTYQKLVLFILQKQERRNQVTIMCLNTKQLAH